MSDYKHYAYLVNVPIVMNVSFLFGTPSPYKLFTVSVIVAFLFASSIAISLATARLVAETLGLRLGRACFFAGGCGCSDSSAFRFFDFLLLTGSARRLRSISSRIRAESSGPGLMIRTSFFLENFAPHCGHSSRLSFSPLDDNSSPLSLSFSEEGVVVDLETVLRPD